MTTNQLNQLQELVLFKKKNNGLIYYKSNTNRVKALYTESSISDDEYKRLFKLFKNIPQFVYLNINTIYKFALYNDRKEDRLNSYK